MRSVFLSLLLLFFATQALSAQERRITGTLVDGDTGEPLEQVAVALHRADSTFIAGTLTSEAGQFTIVAPENGSFLLRLSYVGYVTSTKKIIIDDDHDLAMGEVKMSADAVALQGVTATAQALKVTVEEDTFTYNSSAYRTPEGSAVEELVKRLPGATIDENGKILINGKVIDRVKVGGREFMIGDTETALKNLPASIIDKVKAYSDRSDNAKMTGVDDGVEVMTLDLEIKPGMDKGLLANIDVSYGSRDRFIEKVMFNYHRDKVRLIGTGNFNNTSNTSIGGRGIGFGRGRTGLNTGNAGSLSFSYEDPDKLKVNASVRWSHNTSDATTRTASEQFVTSATAVQSFTNNMSHNYSKNKSVNASARIEWKPDTLTTLIFRPVWQWNDWDGRSGSASATFSADPYKYTIEPLDELDILEEEGIIKNSKTGSGLSYGVTRRVSGVAQLTRRFGNRGRNISVQLSGSQSTTTRRSFSTSNVLLYGSDDDYSINRYSRTPQTNWSYGAQVSYNEPIADRTYVQLLYRFGNSYSTSNRSTYDFSDLDYLATIDPTYVHLLTSLGLDDIPLYRQWDTYLPENYTDYLDSDLCRYSQYRTFTHNIRLQLRRVRENYNVSAGVVVQPVTTHFEQHYLGLTADTVRHAVNIAPTADLRYYFSEDHRHQLRLRYQGTARQPAMTDLISITDNTDPLNISLGNPQLKASFTHTVRANYNNYVAHHNQVVEAHATMNVTRNATTRNVTYDEQTGGRTTQPENINGNWNISAGGMYNTSLDSLATWNINTGIGYSYNNHVGLVSIDNESDAQRNTTRSHNISERLAGSFRNDWFEVELYESINCSASKNELQPTANLTTWGFYYGASTTITSPIGLSLATDLHMRSRRGFDDRALNTNELLWNAQIAQTFLKERNLTIAIQWYDILNQQSNFSRSINASARRDTEFTTINSYFMAHIIFRFNSGTTGK